jgi:hypothetical protein
LIQRKPLIDAGRPALFHFRYARPPVPDYPLPQKNDMPFRNCFLEHLTLFYSRSIKTFVVSASNHERLVAPFCNRSTLRLAQGERIQGSL